MALQLSSTITIPKMRTSLSTNNSPITKKNEVIHRSTLDLLYRYIQTLKETVNSYLKAIKGHSSM